MASPCESFSSTYERISSTHAKKGHNASNFENFSFSHWLRQNSHELRYVFHGMRQHSHKLRHFFMDWCIMSITMTKSGTTSYSTTPSPHRSEVNKEISKNCMKLPKRLFWTVFWSIFGLQTSWSKTYKIFGIGSKFMIRCYPDSKNSWKLVLPP